MIDMSLPNQNLRGMELVEVYGASNIDDAFTSPVKMFEVRYDFTFKESFYPTFWNQGWKSRTEIELDSCSPLTTFQQQRPVAGTRIPTNDEICYLRVRGKVRSTGAFTDFGSNYRPSAL